MRLESNVRKHPDRIDELRILGDRLLKGSQGGVELSLTLKEFRTMDPYGSVFGTRCGKALESCLRFSPVFESRQTKGTLKRRFLQAGVECDACSYFCRAESQEPVSEMHDPSFGKSLP